MMTERELRNAADPSQSGSWLSIERIVLGGVLTGIISMALYASLWAGRYEERRISIDTQLVAFDHRMELLETQGSRGLNVIELRVSSLEAGQHEQDRRIDSIETTVRTTGEIVSRMDERLKATIAKLDEVTAILLTQNRQQQNTQPYPN